MYYLEKILIKKVSLFFCVMYQFKFELQLDGFAIFIQTL